MKSRRRGVSLSELLVVMTACTVVMTITSQLICRVMQIQIQSRAQADTERNAIRLSTRFRSDVHQAKSTTTGAADADSGVLLRLTLADEREVQYSRRQGKVFRQESGTGKPIGREEFEFPASCDVQMEKLQRPERLVLTIRSNQPTGQPGTERGGSSAPTAPASIRVEAVVGADLRLLPTPGVDEAPQ
jgi:hypothetical protein